MLALVDLYFVYYIAYTKKESGHFSTPIISYTNLIYGVIYHI